MYKGKKIIYTLLSVLMICTLVDQHEGPLFKICLYECPTDKGNDYYAATIYKDSECAFRTGVVEEKEED